MCRLAADYPEALATLIMGTESSRSTMSFFLVTRSFNTFLEAPASVAEA